MLNTDLFNLWFRNPVGLAAGFDKDGIALESLAALGFGFIEAGTVTFHPQPGNPKPRMFRLAADQALINRAGFNNAGAAAFARRVEHRRPHNCVLGISIGKSKIAPLEEAPGPLLVKISPDLQRPELEMIVDVIQRLQIDGIIATNTTLSRDNLRTDKRTVDACGAGGLSGKPLTSRATKMIAELYQLTGGRIPLIGVGGIFTAQDAWEKICAGASLVQLYTGFIYKGPRIVRQINEGLVEILRREGFANVEAAVGSQAKAIERNR